MDQQIVDPTLNYNAAISTGDPHFEMEKKKKTICSHRAAVQIVARPWIVILDDTVLSLKNRVHFWLNVNHK